MSKIITSYQQLLREEQEARCRAALKAIDVPPKIIDQLHGPVLFQTAHLCVMIDQPMHWRDALRWINDHKGEVLEHAKNVEAAKTAELEQTYKDLFSDEEPASTKETN